MCRNQTVPHLQTSFQENRFQDVIYSNSPHTKGTHLTVPGAPFNRSVIPFRHSFTPLLRLCLHSDNPKIVSIPTNSILPNMVPSNNPDNNPSANNPSVSNPSKPAFHQKTNIPPFHHSIISEKVLEVRHYVGIQRYRVIQYVTVTNHPCNGY